MTDNTGRLERTNINEPNDLVTVTARVAMTSREGYKEAGESWDEPANNARIMQAGGQVDVGVSDGVGEAEVRQQAHDDFYAARKQAEQQAKQAREEAMKGLSGGSPEELHGQMGLAMADSGNMQMFNGSQSAAEAKLNALAAEVVTAGEFPRGDQMPEREADPGETKEQRPAQRPGQREDGGGYETKEVNPSEDKPYRRQSKGELVEVANGKGIEGADEMSKNDLVAALEAQDEPTAEG